MAKGSSLSGKLLHLELKDGVEDFSTYPFSIPAVQHLGRLAMDPAVTLLIGENGSGKSTLLEAIAVTLGVNPEGGTKNFRFSTRASHSRQTGSRDNCETIAHVIQAFAAQGTWSQAELARRTGIEPRRLCRVLLSLAESGMPLDKDEGGARASSPRVLARRHCCPHRGAHVDLSGCHRAPKTAGIRAARG